MKKIFGTIHGSHLFGTATENSDIDRKEIYIPSGKDILLQRVKSAYQVTPQKAAGEKNQAGDEDMQAFSIQKWFSMIVNGDIIGLELLFAPEPYFLTHEFYDIYDNREIFFSRNVKGYVGYCISQAAKYGIRGSRIASVRGVLDILEPFKESRDLLSNLYTPLVEYAKTDEFTSIIDIPNGDHGDLIPHLECCAKKTQMTGSIKDAYAVYKRVLGRYGERALAAEKNEGIDWKAVSHAVRVSHQAIEFLRTHKLTFPRPEREHLLAIKQGKLPFVQVGAELEDLLEKVEQEVKDCTLPDSADMEKVDRMIEQLHGNAVGEYLVF